MANGSKDLTSIQQKAYEIIMSNIDVQLLGNISIHSELLVIGIDSITFIKIIVALESEFEFEFDDEKLLITEFPTINTMIEYVESKVDSVVQG